MKSVIHFDEFVVGGKEKELVGGSYDSKKKQQFRSKKHFPANPCKQT